MTTIEEADDWEVLEKLDRGDDQKAVYMTHTGKQIFISIGGKVAETLGWKAEELVLMIVGKGSNSGKLRVVRDTGPGTYKLGALNPSKGSLKLHRAEMPGIADCEWPKEMVAHDVVKHKDKDALEILLPDWKDAVPRPDKMAPVPMPTARTDAADVPAPTAKDHVDNAKKFSAPVFTRSAHVRHPAVENDGAGRVAKPVAAPGTRVASAAAELVKAVEGKSVDSPSTGQFDVMLAESEVKSYNWTPGGVNKRCQKDGCSNRFRTTDLSRTRCILH